MHGPRRDGERARRPGGRRARSRGPKAPWRLDLAYWSTLTQLRVRRAIGWAAPATAFWMAQAE